MIKNTIHEIARSVCTGCAACYNKCTVGAISMQSDECGFRVPVIDEAKCVSCGQCLAACPTRHEFKRCDDEKKVFAAKMAPDIQKASASGGLFTLLADYVFKRGGYVCGVAYDNDYMGAHHTVISAQSELQALRGSKYFQSDVGLVMKEVKRLLDDGKYVLFTGTPCQVAGLRTYLKESYDKLIAADIVCHGISSPEVYRSYLNELGAGRKITRVDFREKAHFGWGTASSVFFEDGSVYRANCNDDKYLRAFLGALNTRESCATCPYATIYTHAGDVTLGDFWGIKNIDEQSHDPQGVSLVLVNNKKGLRILEEARAESGSVALFKEFSLEETIELSKKHNGQLLAPRQNNWARKHFFEAFPMKGFNTAFDYAVKSQYDVGIVGWWNNDNYGGILTYYGLNRVLQSMGLSTLMIRHIRWASEKNPDMNKLVYRFAQRYYNISNNYEKGDMHFLNDHVRAFVSGSDQLFNPVLWPYSGPEYFLSFVSNERKIISYASSFGNEYNPNNPHHSEIAYLLNRFDHLSVREDYGVDIMRDNFGIDVEHVMDPVFLCDPKEYAKLADSSTLEKPAPYMANYILDPDAEKRELILKLSEKLGLEYVNLVDATGAAEKAAALDLPNTKPDIDVEDFLFYYKNSDIIVTDSFHGTCFAIIFRKPFISIANRKRGAHRFESVLKAVGLPDRLVYDVNDVLTNDHLFEPIDYDQVYRNIGEKAEKSRKWLADAIFGGKNSTQDPFKLLDWKLNSLEKKLRAEYDGKLKRLRDELMAAVKDNSQLASAVSGETAAELLELLRKHADEQPAANNASEVQRRPLHIRVARKLRSLVRKK